VELFELGLLTESELEEEVSEEEESKVSEEGAADYVWQPVCSDPASEDYDP